MMCWEPVFAFYWGFLVKFFNPAVLFCIVIGILKNDIMDPYEGYSDRWQAVGWFIPIFGVILFVLPMFVCISEEELDYTEFKLEIEMAD